MPAIHVSLIPAGPDAVQLRYWQGNPNQHSPRTLRTTEIAELVNRTERDYYLLGEPDLRDVGTRLYRWLDGSDRWIEAQLEGLRGQGPGALMIECGKGLVHLPWEVLHDGTTFLVEAPNPPVLPVRWKPAGPKDSPPPANRALRALFMATSPVGITPELNFEEEEAQILRATKRFSIGLDVEETGDLTGLAEQVASQPDPYDVVHLTGHADNRPEGPRFLTEGPKGDPVWASATDLVKASLKRPPRMLFLSGCRTGQAAGAGDTRSLAEELLEHGLAAVLGWGRPVRDADAIVAAAALYKGLTEGFSPVEAVLAAIGKMREARARDWHLLRLFAAGAVPGPTVTAPNTAGRKRAPEPNTNSRFLDADKNVKVVGREGFVGRRRPLQRFLAKLRNPDTLVGVVVHGLGGVGKSTLACRLCDRLTEFQRVVHIGVLDEPGLLTSLQAVAGEHQPILQGAGDLKLRLQQFLDARSLAGKPRLLLVLDDFEQNSATAADQPSLLTAGAVAVLDALVWAADTVPGAAMLLITSRYKLETSHQNRFYQEQLSALRDGERTKKLRSLTALREGPADGSVTNEVREQAVRAADGNPRLLEWLDKVLGQPGLDHAAIIAAVAAKVAEFRVQVLAERLLAAVPEGTRRMLAGLLVYELPVPLVAVTALSLDVPAGTLTADLTRAAALGLVEQDPDGDGVVYRVPRLFEPLLAADGPADSIEHARRAVGALRALWWDIPDSLTEVGGLDLIRVATLAGDRELVTAVTDRLLTGRGRAGFVLGMGAQAEADFEEALRLARGSAEDRHLLFLLYQAANTRIFRGQQDTGLKMFKEEILPLTEKLSDVRAKAVALGRIADVLRAGEDLEGALKIYREECLPVYEKLGDAQSRAVALAQIADILRVRGDLDGALNTYREECLPAFDRLGDVRAKAVALGRIADILRARGDLDGALRILREEELPVYERLGDVRSKAITLGRIADILKVRGDLDGALNTYREECLPVFEKLGDDRSRAVTLAQIADILRARGDLDGALKTYRQECLPVYERLGDVRSKAVASRKIADILAARGQLDPALQVLREDALRPIQGLGLIRDEAVFRGRIADILQAQGDLDGALRIYREELPVYEKLGDVRSKAIALGSIADILQVRGDSDGALSGWMEILVILERLGDIHSQTHMRIRIGRILAMKGQRDAALGYIDRAIQHCAQLKIPALLEQITQLRAEIADLPGGPE